jgi:hypothetical protein
VATALALLPPSDHWTSMEWPKTADVILNMLFSIDRPSLLIYYLFKYIPNILYPGIPNGHFLSSKNFHSNVETILVKFSKCNSQS